MVLPDAAGMRKHPSDQPAQQVAREDVDLLDPGGLVPRNDQGDVGFRRRRAA